MVVSLHIIVGHRDRFFFFDIFSTNYGTHCIRFPLTSGRGNWKRQGKIQKTFQNALILLTTFGRSNRTVWGEKRTLLKIDVNNQDQDVITKIKTKSFAGLQCVFSNFRLQTSSLLVHPTFNISEGYMCPKGDVVVTSLKITQRPSVSCSTRCFSVDFRIQTATSSSLARWLWPLKVLKPKTI